MNNRYLFQGKCLGNGEWVTGDLLHWNNAATIFPTNAIVGDFDVSNYVVDPATIGQCTGLTAAKSYRGDGPEDRLVFEGDIGKTSKNGNIVTVMWDSEHLCWCGVSKEYSGTYKINRNFKIIGTIHENTEMLEANSQQ